MAPSSPPARTSPGRLKDDFIPLYRNLYRIRAQYRVEHRFIASHSQDVPVEVRGHAAARPGPRRGPPEPDVPAGPRAGHDQRHDQARRQQGVQRHGAAPAAHQARLQLREEALIIARYTGHFSRFCTAQAHVAL